MNKRQRDVRRAGNHIRLGDSLTAVEGRDGGLPTLIIRRAGAVIARYRGSSLVFATPLGAEDREYLLHLAFRRNPTSLITLPHGIFGILICGNPRPRSQKRRAPRQESNSPGLVRDIGTGSA